MTDRRTHYRTCPLCEATCGLAVEIEGDRVVRVRGDAEDVFSRGYVCPKGTRIGELHHDPDRLRTPLVRRDGELREATWEEAFSAVAEGFERVVARHGRTALAAYVGNPNAHNIAATLYLGPFLKSLGTRSLFSASTLDQMPKHVSSGLMFGHPLTIPIPDVDHTDWLLLLGANPVESNGSLATAPDWPGRLRALRDRGARLVVVDPRATRTAALANEHVRVRPGGDAWLLVGMIHALLDEGLVDAERAGPHVSGLDTLRDGIRGLSPEAVAQACEVPAETIRRLARELATAERAVVYGRIGTHTVAYGTLASWAVDVLNTVTGNLDRPGGALFPLPAHAAPGSKPAGKPFRLGRWKSRVKGHPEAMGELPSATLADEIEAPGDGRIRALFTVAGNPVLSAPAPERLDRALASLELLVSVDIYCNETTRHADVILPPPSPLERIQYDALFYQLAVRNVANFSPVLFEPDGPNEADILAKLALIASGQGPAADPAALHELIARGLAASIERNEHSPAFGRSADEMLAAVGGRRGAERALDLMLRAGPYGDGFGAVPDGLSLAGLEASPHGIDLGPLAPRLPDPLSTASGRVELAPEPIVRDLERLRAGLAAPRPEWLLVGRRHLRSNNSWMHNLEGLVSGRDRCTLQVHPDDAARLGLSDGAPARVRSAAGEVTAPVEISDALSPGVVSLPHGWGHDAPGARLRVASRHAGVNSNRLTLAEPADPLSGNAGLNAIPVEIAPVT
jgi:anaerobic selenocysteine-containing dehydrogenase